MASDLIGTQSYRAAGELFACIGEYEDSAELFSLCDACEGATAAEQVKLLKECMYNHGVIAALMSKPLIRRFLDGEWMKGSTRILYFFIEDSKYRMRYNIETVQKQVTKNDYYGVYENTPGVFYTCDTGDKNITDWFAITIIDKDNIELYVFKTDKTYSLKKK